MQPFFDDYLNILQKLHNEAHEAFEGLSREALDWAPAPEMNSFTVIVTHLAGAERYWIGDVAGENPSGRIRAQEFETSGLDSNALEQRLQDSFDHAKSTLKRLTILELDQQRVGSMDGREVTVGWALAHALEHTALHVGHLQILRQWWDQAKVK
jgi:uncharacterized damage-inducible protein DinB